MSDKQSINFISRFNFFFLVSMSSIVFTMTNGLKANSNSRMRVSSIEQRPIDVLMKMRKLIIFHNIWRFFFLIPAIIVHIIAQVLKSSGAEPYLWLDCILIGRFRYLGRVVRISPVFFIILAFGLISFRLYATLVQPDYRIDCIEFLLYDREVVVKEQTLARQANVSRKKVLNKKLNKIEQKKTITNKATESNLNPLFYIRDPYIENKYYYRECRSPETWDNLIYFQVICLDIGLIVSIVWFCITFYFVGGAIINDLGLELGYPSCVKYIKYVKAQCNNETTSGSWISFHDRLQFLETYIYKPRDGLAIYEMELDDVPFYLDWELPRNMPVNWFTLVRIIIDLYFNAFWYLDFVWSLLAHAFIVHMSSLDLFMNYRALRKRLETIIKRLRDIDLLLDDMAYQRAKYHVNADFESQYHTYKISYFERLTETSYDAQIPSLYPIGTRRNRQRIYQLESDIRCLQTAILDHFNQVRRYQPFVLSFAHLFIYMNIVYLSTICLFLLTTRSQKIVIEFVFTEICLMSLFVVNFLGGSVVCACNELLNPLIASAMALDPNIKTTKLRWSALLNMYRPRPLYCYLISNAIKMSSSFVLKVSHDRHTKSSSSL